MDSFGADYTEFHFEDLVTASRETLKTIGSFIDQELPMIEFGRSVTEL